MSPGSDEIGLIFGVGAVIAIFVLWVLWRFVSTSGMNADRGELIEQGAQALGFTAQPDPGSIARIRVPALLPAVLRDHEVDGRFTRWLEKKDGNLWVVFTDFEWERSDRRYRWKESDQRLAGPFLDGNHLRQTLVFVQLASPVRELVRDVDGWLVEADGMWAAASPFPSLEIGDAIGFEEYVRRAREAVARAVSG